MSAADAELDPNPDNHAFAHAAISIIHARDGANVGFDSSV
jgi:hypothetical protein